MYLTMLPLSRKNLDPVAKIKVVDHENPGVRLPVPSGGYKLFYKFLVLLNQTSFTKLSEVEIQKMCLGMQRLT